MQRFLLEIGVEELPASFLRAGMESLNESATKVLEEARLSPQSVAVQGTPRRLTLVLEGLPAEQAERRESVQGPPWAVAFKDGAPTKAAEGFAKKNGVAVEALAKKETDKGDYVVAEVHEPGRPAAEVLGELLPQICEGIRFPKTMRWGEGDFAFGRPVQWLVALLGDDAVPFAFAGIDAGRMTYGHRFLAPEPVALTRASVYEGVLHDAHVVVDPAKRRALMVERLEAAAKELGGTLVPDDFLVGECADLVEAPFVVPGSFDAHFLELPESVVVSVMRDHQRYFALRGADGKLMNRYLNVVNTAEAPEIIAEGNDRVLKARLADARFFVAEDRKHGMASWRPKLDATVFQRKLGTVGAKVDRIARLSRWLAERAESDVAKAESAAKLAKLNLESLIVFEFPELQGEMGRFYALAEDVEGEVADAIAEHYQPTGADAPVAEGALGAIVGTADRVDTLVGCFGIGLEPTGSNDPFALRRAAISIVRTALEGPIDIHVRELVDQALLQLDGVEAVDKADPVAVVESIHRFFEARLRAFYRDRHAGDVVEATLGAWVDDGFGSVRDLDARMKAVAGFRELPEYEPLAIAFKRANNITKDAEAGAVDAELLEAGAEQTLHDTWEKVRAQLDEAHDQRDYTTALSLVARELKAPIDTYFDDVLVMAEDEAIRANRLTLLKNIADSVTRIAHIHLLGELLMTERHVYLFDDDLGEAYAEPQAKKDLLGGKGAGLNVMRHLGIPVPPGFTITTGVCNHFRTHDQSFPDGMEAQVREALESVEEEVERGFGDPKNPLLVSVRSGARKSMPGMMDTILNLGLTDETVEGLAEGSGDRRFAFDAYRRLLQMYGDVVLGVGHASFEQVLGDLKRELGNGRMLDSEIGQDGLEELVKRYKKLIAREGSEAFPQDVWGQLWGAVGAVFASWDNQRAIRYRRMQGFSDDWGTACSVQAMVFGNMGETSGSGVCFTRNPSTGEKVLYGEYLPNAQGEDVVAGIRTPLNITAEGAPPGREDETLERKMPEVFEAIVELCAKLEAHYGDMQDVELTVERGKAWVLQTRTGKRAAHAAVRIAKELVDEGVLTREQALMNVDASMLDQLLHARLPTPEELEKDGIHPVASGLPASPGAATGKIVFDADHAEAAAKDGEEVILVRRETSPEDIHGMKAAQGIVTATGGMTSHAAVVARGLGKCCVAGCSDLQVDYDKQQVIARVDGGDAVTFGAGDVITLDGTHGKVYGGALDVVAAAKVPELETLMDWADEVRTLRVRANADTPRSARLARSYGAEGIGLCRTEHMFFADERLEAVRCVVLASTAEKRQQWLARVEPMQQQDFAKILKAMDGLPVTVRLLDWPLHEFLPREEKEHQAVADALLEDVSAVKARARQMHEVNPMLGHRAVRVGLTMPAIYEMQVRALLQAALDVSADGVEVHPEIMIPVVGIGGELAKMRTLVDRTAEALFEKAGRKVAYQVGTMIELPRACLVAGELAESAEFFSFGTNDLTQTTFGISRDDAGRFLPTYIDELQILKADPFARLDETGVGELVAIACERGRKQRPDIKLGLCGEHGGDPPSIDFCHRTGLAYVSCSPPRLPIARLAAAQAALRNRV